MIRFEPLGVVTKGEEAIFTAYASRCEMIDINLNIRSDDGEFKFSAPMEWEELNEKGEDKYTLKLKFDKSGLYWYSADEKIYQLSVCEENYHPEWYCEGVTYHIFVDRFNQVGEELTEDNDFYVHTDKKEAPHYLPNEINRDIYGGNLDGITKKLSYFNTLGVKTLYLSPIFEAWSNHKYNTADFSKIDSHFGDEESFKKLCEKAAKLEMRVILDGVFNHVGSDSVYFNKNNRYETIGAYQGKTSPYYKWFNFTENGKYDSWWGIDTLPAISESEESYKEYIAEILKKWLESGASGWRLDVVDELPDEFVSHINAACRAVKRDALIIGEVWEDASNKIAYSVRRKYFIAPELDGVMNYPIRDAIIGFVSGYMSAEKAVKVMNEITLHYPKDVLNCLMNHIGTHDTPRVLTVLARPDIGFKPREEQAHFKLSENEFNLGVKRLKKASVLQYAYPGSPCIYYGDEAGMQGGADPFNRAAFPWGEENINLIEHYKILGKLKINSKAVQHGGFKALSQGKSVILVREFNGEKVYFIVSNCESKLHLKENDELYDIFSGKKYRSHFGVCLVKIPECGYLILRNIK